MTITSSTRLGALALGAVLVLSACSSGGASTAPSTAAAPTTAASAAPAPRRPRASAARSSSRARRRSSRSRRAIAEAFKAANPDFNYTVDGPGTGDGFKRFCAGETDISDASRAIKAEGEADVCADERHRVRRAEGRLRRHHGHDLAGDTAVDCLSFADLYALIGPESHRLRRSGPTPRRSPRSSARTRPSRTPTSTITGPGEESGTYDSFVELVHRRHRRDAQDRRSERARATRPDYVASANDNAIIEGITGSPTLARLGRLRLRRGERRTPSRSSASPRSRTATCVAPTAETIADGSYPISRTLYIYVNKAKAAANPAVAAYVDYYLADGHDHARSSRPSRTSTCRPTSWPPRRTAWEARRVAPLLLEPAGPARRSGRFASRPPVDCDGMTD